MFYVPMLQVPDEYKFIINCTGLGSQELLNDCQMLPVKGQLAKIRTDGKVKEFLWLSNVTYPSTGENIMHTIIPQSVAYCIKVIYYVQLTIDN